MEEKTVKKTKAQRWRLIKNILLCVFGVSFLITGVMFVKIYMNGQKEESSFKALAEAIHNNPVSAVPVKTDASGSESEDGAGSAVDPEYFKPYLALKEQNPDFAGWLNVPNTNIDYPVMYTPEDPEFYLRRGFDKTYFDSGTPFIGSLRPQTVSSPPGRRGSAPCRSSLPISIAENATAQIHPTRNAP